ncbi:unannotated protein [freshwater metagenome]|uniref:Unannotated protein n=1 Tax=freshwater metagenome TaxID=449393 RepID=A0A6J6YPP6_9ZZZZ
MVDVVELNAVEMHIVTIERDGFVIQQGAHNSDDLAHDGERPKSLDANFRCEWIPPCAESADVAAWREVVECAECARKPRRIACPTIDNTRSDLDAIGCRAKRSHGHNGVAHESTIGLPHGIKPFVLGIADQFDSLGNGVGVLQI